MDSDHLEKWGNNWRFRGAYSQLVMGLDSSGQQFDNCKPIDLMGWAPPSDWEARILSKSLADEGESQTLEYLQTTGRDGSGIALKVEEFVRQSRAAQKFEPSKGLPLSILILGCLKNRSPLPPEFWRISIF